MNDNGTNKELNSNPEDLHVYRKSQHPGNTTPAGVAQSMVVLHFSATNPPRLNDEVGQALIPPLLRGTKKLQKLSFGLTILNHTKLNTKEKRMTQFDEPVLMNYNFKI